MKSSNKQAEVKTISNGNMTTKNILIVPKKERHLGIMDREQKEIERIIETQLSNLRIDSNLSNDGLKKSMNLDSTKIAFHKKRVDAWLSGKHVAPITIDMALTQKCSYACTFCYAGLQQNPSKPAEWAIYEEFLDDCVTIGHEPGAGVKAISLVSDGESTENPHFLDFIKKARSNGIDVACGTNGLKLSEESFETLIDNLTYLRININAAEPAAYAEIMGTSETNFHKVINNIKGLVAQKNKRNSSITLGLQMVLLPEYADQVIPLAKLGAELGVDYLVVKHCSDDEKGRLGVDYSWYKSRIATKLLNAAEALSTQKYSVQVKWSKILTGRDRKYSRCYGPPLFLQMSGSGIVAPCGSFFHNRYKRYHIGDIKDKPFREIWNSKEYREVMAHLASKKFDAKTQCATLCLQDKVNERLNDLVENEVPLTDTSSLDQPMHINFI